MNKNRRPQAQKVRNEKLALAMQEKRRSNAAGPHRPKTAYTRKPKYGNRWQ